MEGFIPNPLVLIRRDRDLLSTLVHNNSWFYPNINDVIINCSSD